MIGVSKCMYSRFDGSVGKVPVLIHSSIPVYRLMAARTEYSYGEKKNICRDRLSQAGCRYSTFEPNPLFTR